MSNRTIQVGELARVEGEGAVSIRLVAGKVAELRFRVTEPPRLFEAFLRGRAFTEVPDITSRVCGICPIAYQLSSCRALESIMGIELDGELRRLRRLIYLGEWIESHGLHVFLLHAPDFLGYPDAIAMAKDHRDLVARGLRIKKIGNEILRAMGGREIHPINVRIGGFYRAPQRSELTLLLPELRWGAQAVREVLGWAALLPFPELERDYELVALRHPSEYPLFEGRIASSQGIDIEVREYEQYLGEHQVPYSHALQSSVRSHGGAYLCGPMARFNLSFDLLADEAKEAARAIGLIPPVKNPFKSLLVRCVEILHAFTEAAAIVEQYRHPAQSSVPFTVQPGTGHGCTEAPRGSLYHRYTIDEQGVVREATIVPPTAQNQRAIEDDLRALAPQLAALPHAEATVLAERVVRNHDPCISCSAHSLEVVSTPATR
ncbi:MAG: nickel-dependent hydrogenase large subunit [Pseudomonadota bacterium]